MLGNQQKKPFPKVRIESRFFIAFDPALFFPGDSPVLLQSINHIFGIGIQIDFTGLLEALQSGNHGKELHAVVCCQRFSPGYFFLFSFIAQNGTPAAGAGVSAAGAVCVDGNLFSIQHRAPVPRQTDLLPLRFRKNALSSRYRSPSHLRPAS